MCLIALLWWIVTMIHSCDKCCKVFILKTFYILFILWSLNKKDISACAFAFLCPCDWKLEEGGIVSNPLFPLIEMKCLQQVCSRLAACLQQTKTKIKKSYKILFKHRIFLYMDSRRIQSFFTWIPDGFRAEKDLIIQIYPLVLVGKISV